jgi:hypothetical protein
MNRVRSGWHEPLDLSGWRYGDFPYGLEPLVLPPAGEAVHSRPYLGSAEVNRNLAAAWADRRAGVEPASMDSLEQLFWFRWITGHQISFIVWQLLAAATSGFANPTTSGPLPSQALTQYVRGYSGMLLYTSSCSRTVYSSAIRPSMYRQHRWFSGTWAPDYLPVRELLRGQWMPPLAEPDRPMLAQEVELCRQAHAGASVKLVPDGVSFVAHAVSASELRRPHSPGALYDHFFLTSRAKVTGRDVAAQLVRRVHAVLLDLAANGLYVSGTTSAAERPSELWTASLSELEDDLPQALLRVVAYATGGS